jgi:hypothetical protein
VIALVPQQHKINQITHVVWISKLSSIYLSTRQKA